MARKRYSRRRRRDKNFVVIPFAMQFELGTLADDNVESGLALGTTFGEDIYIISVDAAYHIVDATQGEGPIEVGFSHSQLTNAQIEECLQAEQTKPDDLLQNEYARRPVRRVGAIPIVQYAISAVNQGDPVRTPARFSIGDGHMLDFWACNRSGATLTTGARLEVYGTIFGRWQR